MSILPEDKPQHPTPQPHNFFIWGATMSGKSYFASFFPHPLSLNTDGNSEQGSAPSIQVRNIRAKDGSLKQSVIDQLDEIITALQSTDNTFQTVIIDVIDDICVMIEQAICIDNDVQALSDIPYGKGYAMFNSVLQQFVMDLKALPMNVILRDVCVEAVSARKVFSLLQEENCFVVDTYVLPFHEDDVACRVGMQYQGYQSFLHLSAPFEKMLIKICRELLSCEDALVLRSFKRARKGVCA